MGRDLFAAPVNGHKYTKLVEDSFRYICGVFSGDGAVQILRRANQIPLATYFPIRFNVKGEPVPLWRSYLLIEFREGVTINLCRTTSHFLKVVSERDEDGQCWWLAWKVPPRFVRGRSTLLTRITQEL
jgi:hypothetical protein